MTPAAERQILTHGGCAVAIRSERQDMDACKEMVAGFLEGYDVNNPEPGFNRSRCYRHGFANGRDDIGLGPDAPHPRASAEWLRDEANRMMVGCGCEAETVSQ